MNIFLAEENLVPEWKNNLRFYIFKHMLYFDKSIFFLKKCSFHEIKYYLVLSTIHLNIL